MEETQLAHREAILTNGGNDPGRPPYSDFYQAFDAEPHNFNFLFTDTYPDPVVSRAGPPVVNYQTLPVEAYSNLAHLPSSSLICSVNICVYMRLAVLTFVRVNDDTTMVSQSSKSWIVPCPDKEGHPLSSPSNWEAI